MGQRYMDMKQAAVYLGVSYKALRKRVERRSIPFIKDRKRVMFDSRALDSYMAERAIAFIPAKEVACV
jgi:excisionase family DNA binding protein